MMKLKLHRTVRTPHSEEIYVYDLDQQDEAGEPLDIGKMDLHYTDDQIVGSLLLWKDWHEGVGASSDLQAVVDEILEEISEPLGVSAEYDIEYYICDRDTRQFVSNIEDDFAGIYEDDEDDDEDYEDIDEDESEDESLTEDETARTSGPSSTTDNR